jgi:hypothetical protein
MTTTTHHHGARRAPVPVRLVVGLLVAFGIVAGAPLALALAVQAGPAAVLILAVALLALYRVLR